jgi:hypothetical protein
MRPVAVVVGGAIAALGASALGELVRSRRSAAARGAEEEFRDHALGVLYAVGVVLLGLAVLAYGLRVP